MVSTVIASVIFIAALPFAGVLRSIRLLHSAARIDSFRDQVTILILALWSRRSLCSWYCM
ncbi:hypothetical protein CH251_13735 [Rhodococcus sp. 06-462-5]|nr:hypothetical protein CH251_13735 [Rhodococcus sp. 06-462-5]OZE63408.1 hypothetical protein CH270_18110 [Rhodococcus sp. 02-925g]